MKKTTIRPIRFSEQDDRDLNFIIEKGLDKNFPDALRTALFIYKNLIENKEYEKILDLKAKLNLQNNTM